MNDPIYKAQPKPYSEDLNDLVKAEIEKGGQGSGVKGHITPQQHKKHVDSLVDAHSQANDHNENYDPEHHRKQLMGKDPQKVKEQHDALHEYLNFEPKKKPYKGNPAQEGIDAAKDDAKFSHHRKMAAYHSIHEKHHSDQMSDLRGNKDPDLQSAAKEHKAQREMHSKLAEHHRKEAEAHHDPERHGHWNQTVPSAKEAMDYGHKHHVEKAYGANEGGF